MSRLFLLKMMPKKAVCAEIGVWKGAFSREIVSFTNPSKLYLIDPWAYQPKYIRNLYGGKGGLIKNQEDVDKIYEAVKDRYLNNQQVEILKGFSEDMLVKIPDGHLDWVYIDGDHSYSGVLKDLQMCYAKTKTGGYICGDDYSRAWKGVMKAVNEFLADGNNIEKILIQKRQFILRKT